MGIRLRTTLVGVERRSGNEAVVAGALWDLVDDATTDDATAASDDDLSLAPKTLAEAWSILEAMNDLQVALQPSNITVTGNTARASVTGTWTYRGGQLDVNNQYVFERRATGWVIIAIE